MCPSSLLRPSWSFVYTLCKTTTTTAGSASSSTVVQVVAENAAVTMPPKFPVHPLQTEPLTTTIVREVKSIWPFFLGFGVVGYAMAMISIPTEEDLKKSTITPHEDKAMASTA